MLQNLRIGLKKRRNGKRDVLAKQRGNWPKISWSKKRNINLPSSRLPRIGVSCTFKKETGGKRICCRLRRVDAHDKQEGFEFCRIGNRDDIEKSDDSYHSQWRSADQWGSYSARQRIGFILDVQVPREYARSFVAGKALRGSRIDPVSGPVVKNSISLKVADGYNATRRITYRSLSLVWRQALLLQARLLPHLQHRPREILKIQHRVQHQHEVREKVVQYGETRRFPTCQTGYKSSPRTSWMKEFLNTETHTRVLLTDHVKNRREKWYRVNTVFVRISRKTEIAISAREPKLQGLLAEKRRSEAVPRAENFGDLITADHKVLSEGCESRNNHRYAVVVQDLASQWIQSFPCKTKTFQETEKSLQKYLEPTRKPKVIHTDNCMEFGKACEDLSWNHCTSTPNRSETNGIAERAARRIKEGTSAVLLQSGMNENWWADSMECFTYLRNVQDLLSDGKALCERRLGEPSEGPIIPFGSMIEHHPMSVKDLSRLHQFGKNVLPGIFFGYPLYAGRIWKGDILVVDLEELEKVDASEIHAKRLNAKEVTTPKDGEKFVFPIADGKVKLSGGDQNLTASSLIRDNPKRGEEPEDFLWESEGSPPPHQDSLADAGEARDDFWSSSGDAHWTKSQTLHAERRMNLSQFHWNTLTRATHTR